MKRHRQTELVALLLVRLARRRRRWQEFKVKWTCFNVSRVLQERLATELSPVSRARQERRLALARAFVPYVQAEKRHRSTKVSAFRRVGQAPARNQWMKFQTSFSAFPVFPGPSALKEPVLVFSARPGASQRRPKAPLALHAKTVMLLPQEATPVLLVPITWPSRLIKLLVLKIVV